MNNKPYVSEYPKLLSEWDYEKNKKMSLTPDKTTIGSGKSVWWKCSRGHSWKTSVAQRNKQEGCPYCRGRKIWPGYNDFATLFPDLLTEWDYERNTTDPNTVAPASTKKYYWICRKGHKYESTIASRTRLSTGCPYCSNQKLLVGFNDFQTMYPKIAQEWDYGKNTKSPSEFIGASENYAWWICKKGHSWRTMISTRVSGTGCPKCAKEYKTSIPEQAVFFYCKHYFPDTINSYKPEWLGKSEVDVFIPSKSIAIEFDGRAWHKNVEKDIKKNELCKAHGITIFRIREPGLVAFDDNCIEIPKISYKSLNYAIYTLLQRLGVNNPKINVENDLDNIYELMSFQEKEKSISKKYPRIAMEWDYEHNSKYLSPETLNYNSKIKVSWICPQGHHYEARVEHRTRTGSGCPVCAGKKVITGFNDLDSHYPELSKEWDYEKNSILPTEIYYSSTKKVWWKCKESHSWKASIQQRVRTGSGCPYCAGQKVITGVNDLATAAPDLLNEWDYDKNVVSPKEMMTHSRMKVWWICAKGHSWQDSIRNRFISKRRLCPICRMTKSDE